MPVGPRLQPKETRESLNQHGEQGWELIGTVPAEHGPLLIFKRPKQ